MNINWRYLVYIDTTVSVTVHQGSHCSSEYAGYVIIIAVANLFYLPALMPGHLARPSDRLNSSCPKVGNLV